MVWRTIVPPTSDTRPDEAARGRGGMWFWLRRVLVGALAAVAAWVLLLAVGVLAYRWFDPPFTTLTLLRAASGTSIDRRPVRIERISPNLVRAVIVSEDGRFCSHGGVDWDAIGDAIEDRESGIVRGGSTITMQVAKNLFLWHSRSYVRKVLEIGLAHAIGAWWPRERILEVYLNIAEWGPGIFGAEAAARQHFGKSAVALSEREAALLATALPSPLTRNAAAPGPVHRRLAQVIEQRARAAGPRVACIPGVR